MRWNLSALSVRLFGAALLSCSLSGWVAAQAPNSGDAPDEPKSEMQLAWQAAGKVARPGPDSITLLDQATLQLPEGYYFVPANEGARIMRAMGNTTSDRFVGLVLPKSDAEWFVTVNFEDSGYVKDDEAKDWDAKELLQSLKDGTEEANKRRVQMGVDAIKVTRWVEPPKYDATSHQLVWSAEAKLRDREDPDPTINYNTYVLGRDGYMSLNLITVTSTIDQDKLDANKLLAAVAFVDGKKYTDFNSSTDKVAAYGLAALIGGIAIKKLGLLAVIGAFALKFAKIIAVGAVALGGAVTKFFKRKSDDGTAA